MSDINRPFKFAESCMFRYLGNLARIKALQEDLKIVEAQSSVKVQNYEERSSPDGYIDNIPGRILKIDALENLIADLERWTKPITRLLSDLESPYSSPERQEMLEIMRMRYISDYPWDRCADRLKMSRTTFFVRRKQLVELVISYMGLSPN